MIKREGMAQIVVFTEKLSVPEWYNNNGEARVLREIAGWVQAHPGKTLLSINWYYDVEESAIVVRVLTEE